ncbi:MAG: aldehyde dehydrogenase family protein [Bacteroidetes bacterium]|nr:aldehyde dehydrogenase family protein [Bacteroidota bacterium]
MDTAKTQTKKEAIMNGSGENGHASGKKQSRIDVLKTYKIYIDGKFPRTESGRYYILKAADGRQLGNICQSSRKDFREAVVAARKAQPGWSAKTAYNKGQILYRIAEVLEGRKSQFIDELMQQGIDNVAATEEVNLSIDRLVHYAGWSDKFIQVFSSVNPVESSHFNFSIPEPTGVVSVIGSEKTGLIGLISVIAPAIVGGNTVVVLASESKPLCAISLAEVLQTSDVPAGVVNLLTGNAKELNGHFSSHMDVNAIAYCNADEEQLKTIQINAANNVKRVLDYSKHDWMNAESQSPYFIMDFQEIKTTWHPIGQ